MPSEKRRQRQQRVRHEAGDFVPTDKDDSVENNEHESNNIKNDVGTNERDVKQTEIHYEAANKVASTPVAERNDFRRTDERKYNQRSNERDERQTEIHYKAANKVASTPVPERNDFRTDERKYNQRSNERDERQTEIHYKAANKVASTPVPERNDFRRTDDRRYNQRSNEMTRGSMYRGRGGYARGGRRPEYETQQRKPETRSCDGNVAYQEEREYEPVRIMESKMDKEKEVVQSLPEPTKYRRSEVISNWLQYEDLPPDDEPEDGEDYLIGEDFSQVLNLNVNKSCGGFLHLKGELSWGQMDQSHLENHGLGALKVADLIASLGTIPFHEQLKIPDEALPVFLVSTVKADAEKNRISYQPNQEYVTDIEINQKILESLKLSENEPIQLSTEEPKSCDTHSAYDATLKFSSAFKPEPTDVDLDALIKDVSEAHVEEIPPERVDKEIVSEKPSQMNPVTSVNKLPHKEGLQSDKKHSKAVGEPNTRVTPPKTSSAPQAKKPNFDFGLSKANKSTKKGTAEKKSEEVSSANVEEKPSIKIDLNKPTNVKKEAPVLVKESEVENLEDWLDSVLDD